MDVSDLETEITEVNVPSDRVVWFVVFIVVALICLIVACCCLPFILLSPSNFAIWFTVGCLAAHFAIACTYDNPLDYFIVLVSSVGNMLFIVIYLASVAGTLYFALLSDSYILTLVCSVVQLGCAGWFVCTQVDGGTESFQNICDQVFDAMKSIF